MVLRPSDPARSRHFYRHLLGLAVYREFGPPENPGMVFFMGQSLLEISGGGDGSHMKGLALWLQVRDVHQEHGRLEALGVTIRQGPRPEPWGLVEMWIEDPDGLPIVLVEVPEDHPLRRDSRSL